MAALVERLGERMGEHTETMRDALSNIQIVFVALQSKQG
jgi:hypothetical protein